MDGWEVREVGVVSSFYPHVLNVRERLDNHQKLISTAPFHVIQVVHTKPKKEAQGDGPKMP